MMSWGYMAFSASPVPMYRHTQVEIITSTMVDRMQMLARPTAFCFIPVEHAGNSDEVLGLVVIVQ